MAKDYEGLQAVPQNHSTGYSTLEPNVSNSRFNPEQAPEAQKSNYYGPDAYNRRDEKAVGPGYEPQSNYALASEGGHAPPPSGPTKKRICGLAPRTFYVTLAIIIAIIVAGALGGGLGGGLAHKSSSSSSSHKSEITPSATPITAPASLSSLVPTKTFSISDVIGPSSTLKRDCPDSDDSVYGVQLGAHKQLFRKKCSQSFVNAHGIDSVVNQPTGSLNECIDLCASFNAANDTSPHLTHPLCTAVCWRNTFINDDFPGQCFGYSTNNGTDGFQMHPDESQCDGAALILAN